MPELLCTIKALNIDILIRNETWLDSSVLINFIKNFDIYREDRIDGRGRNFLIAFKNNIT